MPCSKQNWTGSDCRPRGRTEANLRKRSLRWLTNQRGPFPKREAQSVFFEGKEVCKLEPYTWYSTSSRSGPLNSNKTLRSNRMVTPTYRAQELRLKVGVPPQEWIDAIVYLDCHSDLIDTQTRETIEPSSKHPHRYTWSECRLAAISASALSPLARSFSLLYRSSSRVSVENSWF